MSERAHPHDPAFQDKWVIKRLCGVIPIPWLRRNPYRTALERRYRWVSEQCAGKDVLDIPCGVGWGTAKIKGARSIFGVDLSEEAISEAKKRFGSIAEFSVGDMQRLMFPDDSLDVVCCLEGIEHVPTEIGAVFLREAYRVLRPNGQLMISSPYCRHQAHSGNPYHVHEYRPQEIIDLLRRHFRIGNLFERDVDIMTVLYLQCTKGGPSA